MAIIAGNFDLAEIIKVHKASDVGEFVAAVEAGLSLLFEYFNVLLFTV